MVARTVALLLAFCAACAFSASDDETIYVHIVPHTHDDVGWLKTVDEYYYGADQTIQDAAVQFILDTVILELQQNPNRTFIYVEIAFFTRWWNEQSDATKEIVKKLVTNKQLEFVNAGWCMNDEASTDYNGIIDQMTLGLQFVAETFGPEARPRAAWHIDPFGHSAEQAALFALMGYDGFFFGRIDYDDRKKRYNDTTMEMVWRPSTSLGVQAEIFTGVLFTGYGPPPGLCFDTYCTDPPIQDDPDLFDYNVNERVATFNRAAVTQASKYATNHIMFTMGSDFQYKNAREWYKNLDKLLYYVNEQANGTIQAFYSTPSRYIDALYQAQKTWTVKTDDFFPYADKPYSYWTGYFTSRPALKGYIRKMNSLLQSCKQLDVIGAQLPRQSSATPFRLAEAMGVNQHHDAVSGTEKQHVADDYAKRLHIGQVECEELINDVAVSYASGKTGERPPNFQFCEYLNISICPASETDSFNVMIYNPIGRPTLRYFQFPVNSEHLTITDGDLKEVPCQVLPVSDATKAVRRDRGNATIDLLFGDTLPALGAKTYFVRPATATGQQCFYAEDAKHADPEEDTIIENPILSLTFDGTTGRLKNMMNKKSGISIPVDQQFLWWNSSAGNNINSTQASGAYIFRPNGTAPFEINTGNKATIKVVKSLFTQEVRQEFAPWLYQTVRLYSEYPMAVFEYTVGPIPFQDGLGKEIVSRFSTGLNTEGTWYTDANGREIQKRVRYFRPTWKLNNTEPVAENYYPVNSRIYIRDETKNIQFTVLTDRSQGGSSLNDGQVELMVHRRCLHDDGRGVGEPLNETGQFGDGLIIRGKHVVLLDNIENSTVYHRIVAEALMMEPVHGVQPSTDSPSDYVTKYFTNYAGITMNLPYNVHLLTLQSLMKDHVLIRLEHLFQADEFPFNQSVPVSLDNLFVSFTVTAATELTLGANAQLDSVHRLQWKTTDDMGKYSKHYGSKPVKGPDFTVELKPMEIRTFDLTVQPN